jgi:CBS domain-containing membrane protein
VHRTPDVSTTKPEAVGHLMATTVTVCSETAHIAELIPLMANNGHRQIPIVNYERRLVGIVYQADLIAALYHQLLAHQQN